MTTNEEAERKRAARCARESTAKPLPMWKSDGPVKYTFGGVVRTSTDGKSRVIAGTRVDSEKDATRKIIAKLVLKGDDFFASAFREAQVWAVLKRYVPLTRLQPPIECLQPNRLVFQRLGVSLAEIREEHGPFGIEATFRLGLEMLAAIRELHQCGFMHRNLTPGHFCLHPNNSPAQLFRGLVLVDLSQAAPYFAFAPLHNSIPDSLVHPSPVFSSPNITMDELQAVGRHDDLFSWFYILLYLRLTELPWAKSVAIEMPQKKRTATTVDLNQTCKPFGPVAGEVAVQIATHLHARQPQHMPGYARLYRLMGVALGRITDGQFLSIYCDEMRVAADVVLRAFKDAIVQPPRFSTWNQQLQPDGDYKKTVESFRVAYNKDVDQPQFAAIEAKAAESRAAYADRHLQAEGRKPLAKITKAAADETIGAKTEEPKKPVEPIKQQSPIPTSTPTTSPAVPAVPQEPKAENKESESSSDSDSSDSSSETRPSPATKESEFVAAKGAGTHSQYVAK